MNDAIIKAETRWGIDWYKVLSKDSGINLFLQTLKAENTNMRLVKRWHPKKGQFWGIVPIDVLPTLIKENNFLFEILEPDIHKKVYFDIDRNTNGLDECKAKIIEFFPNANLQISGYEKDSKSSYHIIVSNYIIKNVCQLSFIKDFVINNTDIGFDSAVYGKYNLFKCINQSKQTPNSPIQQFLEGSTVLSKHLICQDFDEILYDVPELSPKYITSKLNKLTSKLNILEINVDNIHYELPENFDYINALSIDKLRIIPNNLKVNLGHLDTIKIMSWAKNENILFTEFWKWCSSKSNTESRRIRYLEYWNKSHYHIPESFIDNILLIFYPKLKMDNSREDYRILNEIIPTKIIDVDYMDAKYISDCKYSFLDILMGGNKTGAVLDFIKLNNFKRVLFISPRVALSKDILGRMKTVGLDFSLYSDIENKLELGNHNNLIMSVNSIYYLAETSYDLVIIDEIETVFTSFKGQVKTHIKPEASWYNFMRLIKESKKCIIMDALLSTKTINVIKANEMEFSHEILTLERKQEPLQFFKYKLKQFNLWINSIIHSIQKNEKVFVFMPYKAEKTGSKKNPLANITSLIKMLCEQCNLIENTDIIGYFAEQTEQKNELFDIENIWKKAKVIIANTSIAVGNNYSGKDFTRIFAYYSSWLDIREFFQALKRVRFTIDKTIQIYFEKVMPKNDEVIIREFDIPGDLAFKALQTGFNIENNVKNHDKFEIIKNRCNITDIDNDELFNVVKQIRIDIICKDYIINFYDIPYITFDELQSLIKPAFNNHHSLMDNLMIEKALLQNKFNQQTTPEPILEWWWNNQLLLERLEYLVLNPNHLLLQIFKANKLDFWNCCNFTLTQITAMKIPSCITNDEIKQAFKLHNPIVLRDITLVKRLFNSFFGFRYIVPKKNGYYINKDTGKTRQNYSRIVINKVGTTAQMFYSNKIILLGEEVRENNQYRDFKESIQYFKQYNKIFNKKLDRESNGKCLIIDEIDFN